MGCELLRRMSGVGLLLMVASAASADKLVVLTSYPEEVFAKFEAAFEREHPDIDLDVVWRMPHDAAPFLRDAGRGSVDVYWAASYRTFKTLAAEGRFQPLTVDRSQVPGHVGPFRLSDPDGRFEAVEMAGFGLLSAPRVLAARGLPIPTEWSDVADPRYEGLVVLPIPSRVGFAPNMIDTILQAHGWHAGWSLVSRIAANAKLMEAGSTFLTDEIGAGRAGVALTIDFFARSAIANGAPFAFRYPSTGGYSFAHVALLAEAPHAEAGRRFAAFLTSPAGQALLADRDIRKLSIRPDSYGADAEFNPFADAAAEPLRYEPDRGIRRYALINALFDQLVTQRHAALKSAWHAVRLAEQAAATTGDAEALAAAAAARRTLEQLPVAAADADNAELLAIFDTRRHDATADARAKALEAEWSGFFVRNIAEATRQAEAVRVRVAGR